MAKNKNKKLKINVIDGSLNQKSSRKKTSGVIDKIAVEEKIDAVIRSRGQVDIIAAFDNLFSFETISSDELTIYQQMAIGHQTESGKIPRIYRLLDNDGVDRKINETMKNYLCPHDVVVGEGKKKFAKHVSYPVSQDDPAYNIYKPNMIPHGWRLGRCAICGKIELIEDESVDPSDRTNLSDILAQASLAVETLKSLYALSIHREIATISQEDENTQAQIIHQLEILRQFSGQMGYNLAEIAKDLDKGISIEEKNEKDKTDDIISSYGIDTSILNNKKK